MASEAAIRILGIRASADQSRLDRFLGFSANEKDVRRFLGSHRHGLFYDETGREATFVAVTGVSLVCFAIYEITRDQADRIDSQLEQYGPSARLVVTEFQTAVTAVTGQETQFAGWYAEATS